LLYQPARLHRLAESIARNRFLGSLNVYKCGLRYRNYFTFRYRAEDSREATVQDFATLTHSALGIRPNFICSSAKILMPDSYVDKFAVSINKTSSDLLLVNYFCCFPSENFARKIQYWYDGTMEEFICNC
jgi:hypothetical protein